MIRIRDRTTRFRPPSLSPDEENLTPSRDRPLVTGRTEGKGLSPWRRHSVDPIPTRPRIIRTERNGSYLGGRILTSDHLLLSEVGVFTWEDLKSEKSCFHFPPILILCTTTRRRRLLYTTGNWPLTLLPLGIKESVWVVSPWRQYSSISLPTFTTTSSLRFRGIRISLIYLKNFVTKNLKTYGILSMDPDVY